MDTHDDVVQAEVADESDAVSLYLDCWYSRKQRMHMIVVGDNHILRAERTMGPLLEWARDQGYRRMRVRCSDSYVSAILIIE